MIAWLCPRPAHGPTVEPCPSPASAPTIASWAACRASVAPGSRLRPLSDSSRKGGRSRRSWLTIRSCRLTMCAPPSSLLLLLQSASGRSRFALRREMAAGRPMAEYLRLYRPRVPGPPADMSRERPLVGHRGRDDGRAWRNPWSTCSARCAMRVHYFVSSAILSAK